MDKMIRPNVSAIRRFHCSTCTSLTAAFDKFLHGFDGRFTEGARVGLVQWSRLQHKPVINNNNSYHTLSSYDANHIKCMYIPVRNIVFNGNSGLPCFTTNCTGH